MDLNQESEEKLNRDTIVLRAELRNWWVHKIIGPLEKLLINYKISPNQITLATSAICFFATYFFAQGYIVLAGWWVLLLGSLDILDGRVARATNQVSDQGAFLDSVMDRYQDFAIYLGLALYFRNHWVFSLVMLAFAGSFFTSYVRAKAGEYGVELGKIGFMQRPERIFMLGFGSILSGLIQISLQPFYGYDMRAPHHILVLVVIALAIGTNWTAFERIKASFEALKNKERD